MDRPDQLPKAIGKRLEAVRLANGFEVQADFADAIGVGRTVYNAWETGAQRPGLTSVLRLVDRFGLTLDFIYRGNLASLHEDVRKSIVLQLAKLKA